MNAQQQKVIESYRVHVREAVKSLVERVKQNIANEPDTKVVDGKTYLNASKHGPFKVS